MAEREMHAAEPENPDVHHETRDVNVRVILWFAFGFVVVAIAIHVLIWGIYSLFTRMTEKEQGPPVTRVITSGPRVPPAPNLQRLKTNPVIEMRQLREKEEDILNNYGVADRVAGTVRIPIDEAIKLAVQRPEMFPVRVQPAPAVPAAGDATPNPVLSVQPGAGAVLAPGQHPVDQREQLLRAPEEKRPESRQP